MLRECATLIRAAGAKLLFLPKYSPDLNPIEQAFANLKQLLRKAAPPTLEAVCTAIGEILGAFTPEECANYFGKSGYSPKLSCSGRWPVPVSRAGPDRRAREPEMVEVLGGRRLGDDQPVCDYPLETQDRAAVLYLRCSVCHGRFCDLRDGRQ